MKPAVLEELLSMGDKVDLKPIYRSYIESLWRIHSQLRALVADDVSTWDLLLMQTIKDFCSSGSSSDLPGSSLIERENDGSIVSAEYLFHDIVQERKYYENRNRNLNNISKRYVTGDTLKSDV